MTELNPPPGKTWIVLEMTPEQWDTGDFDYEELDAVAVLNGPNPVDLLVEASQKFDEASRSFPGGSPLQTGELLAEGSRILARAIDAIREAQ